MKKQRPAPDPWTIIEKLKKNFPENYAAMLRGVPDVITGEMLGRIKEENPKLWNELEESINREPYPS